MGKGERRRNYGNKRINNREEERGEKGKEWEGERKMRRGK